MPPRTSVPSVSPWLFVPAIYLAVGAGGGGVLGALTAIMLKDMRYPNAIVGAAALLALPSALRFLWAPRVDRLAAKRPLCWRFTFLMAAVLGGLAAALALGLVGLPVIFGFLFLFAFVLSMQGSAADGYYIRVFDRLAQARYIGLKAAAVRVGILLVLVLFVSAAGILQQARAWPRASAWAAALAGAAILLAALALLMRCLLPPAPDDEPVRVAFRFPLRTVLRDYFGQKNAWAVVLVLLVFRFGEGMLTQMTVPFYMDTATAGGFGLDPRGAGLLKALTDLPWMTLGGIAGGFAIARFGFRRTLYPLAAALYLPNFAYIYLASARPAGTFVLFGQTFPTAVFLVSCVESLGYGLGFSAFYYYIHARATGPERTSLLAVSTGLLTLSFTIPGAVSGVIEQAVGYPAFFAICALAGVATFGVLPFLPDPADTPSPH